MAQESNRTSHNTVSFEEHIYIYSHISEREGREKSQNMTAAAQLHQILWLCIWHKAIQQLVTKWHWEIQTQAQTGAVDVT